MFKGESKRNTSRDSIWMPAKSVLLGTVRLGGEFFRLMALRGKYISREPEAIPASGKAADRRDLASRLNAREGKRQRILRYVLYSLVAMALIAALLSGVYPRGARRESSWPGGPGDVRAARDLEEGSHSLEIADFPDFEEPDQGLGGGVQRKALLNTTIPDRPMVEVISYTVQGGDSLFAIADRFNLKPETVLWGNYDVLEDNPHLLSPGQELNILPVDGVYYRWKQGDTMGGVANSFGVDSDAILEWPGNPLDLYQEQGEEVALEPGTWLIIPGGRRPLKDWGPPPISRSNPASAAYYGSGYCGQIYEGAVGNGTFVWPTPSRSISGYDYSPGIHPALDIAGAEGNAVYATDSGVVVFAGWSEYGYGYLIVIDHGTGWQSAYAHLSAVGVTCGQNIAQGNVIGAVGNTGNSSGPHLHFELRSEIYGKANPWNFLIP
jgi:murein DD-endopeptidase MepM/ murein hydrolase activator NlpD